MEGRTARRELPGCVDHQDPADIVIGQSTAQTQIEKVETADPISKCIAGNHS